MQIVLFLIFILFLILILAIKKDDLSTKTKTTILTVILVTIGMASIYEFSKNSSAEEKRLKVNTFLQGKTLKCMGVDVSKETFEYVNGTQTFVPKDSNYEHKGLILEVQKCEIK